RAFHVTGVQTCALPILEHARVWDQLARQLCDEWHVVVPDLRGHGDSDWSLGGAYAIPDFLPDIAALFAELGGQPATVVAHSLGGDRKSVVLGKISGV